MYLLFSKNYLENWYHVSQIILLFVAMMGGFFAYKTWQHYGAKKGWRWRNENGSNASI